MLYEFMPFITHLGYLNMMLCVELAIVSAAGSQLSNWLIEISEQRCELQSVAR